MRLDADCTALWHRRPGPPQVLRGPGGERRPVLRRSSGPCLPSTCELPVSPRAWRRAGSHGGSTGDSVSQPGRAAVTPAAATTQRGARTTPATGEVCTRGAVWLVGGGGPGPATGSAACTHGFSKDSVTLRNERFKRPQVKKSVCSSKRRRKVF